MQTPKLSIYRAQNVGMRIVSPTVIEITEELPHIKDLKELRQVFQKEAFELVDALFNSLPGGTLDEVLAEMMRRKASFFVVPFGDK
jgi:hypothetical protein